MVNPVRSEERLRDDYPEIQHRIALFRELVSWQKSRDSFGKSSCWTFHDLRSAVSGPTEGVFSALSDAIAAGVFKGIDGMPYWASANKNVTDSEEDACYRLRTWGGAVGVIAGGV